MGIQEYRVVSEQGGTWQHHPFFVLKQSAVGFTVPEVFPAHLIHNAWPGALHRIFPASVHCSTHRAPSNHGDAKPQTPRLAENLLQDLLKTLKTIRSNPFILDFGWLEQH